MMMIFMEQVKVIRESTVLRLEILLGPSRLECCLSFRNLCRVIGRIFNSNDSDEVRLRMSVEEDDRR